MHGFATRVGSKADIAGRRWRPLTGEEVNMSYYNLRRMADNEILSAVCHNHEAALVEFGEELGVTLTLEEGPAVAEYMMGCHEETVGWIKTDIPVFVVRP